MCDIKVSGQQLKELAGIIGPGKSHYSKQKTSFQLLNATDCTPKAVTHRLAKFKKMAGTFNGGKKGGDAAAEDADGEGGATTPKKTKKGGKGGKVSKKRAAESAAEDDDDAEGEGLKQAKLEASDESA